MKTLLTNIRIETGYLTQDNFMVPQQKKLQLFLMPGLLLIF